MTTPAGTPATSPRRYGVGDTIPSRGIVVHVSLTAYQVRPGAVALADAEMGGEPCRWVPFYGPHGVDEQRPVEGLVTFADGSRYGGPCPDHFIGTETLRCLTCGATS